MGTVPNVGLMAQQAEEYGSTTRPSKSPKTAANITDLATGEVLLSQNVGQGDIWRMCQVKDARSATGSNSPSTARATPACRWCSGSTVPPSHEAQLITKVKMYLHEHDTAGLDIQIMSQVRACATRWSA